MTTDQEVAGSSPAGRTSKHGAASDLPHLQRPPWSQFWSQLVSFRSPVGAWLVPSAGLAAQC
jgi:hypothetical protein